MKNTAESKEGTQVYELGYLVLPSIAEENLPQVVAKIEKMIASHGGEKIDGEEPVKIDLSYTMTKVVGASRYVVNDAYIGWVKFEAETAAAPAIKAEAETMDELVRALLIKAPRESEFTFAKAQALLEKEAEAETSEEGDSEPKEAVVE